MTLTLTPVNPTSLSLSAGTDTSLALSQTLNVSSIVLTFSSGTGMTAGRSAAGSTTPDFLFDANWKLKTKGVLLADIGDTPDLGLRAAGPVGAAYDATASAWANDTNIANIYFQSYDGTTFDPGSGTQSRSANIYARTTEAPTSTGRGAKLGFATCPNGSVYAQDAVTIGQDGTVALVRGSGQKLTADFSSALANRCVLATTSASDSTMVGAAPTGTSRVAELAVYNAAAGSNAGYLRFRIDSTDAILDTNKTGTGTEVPLSIQFSGATKIKVNGTGIGFFGVTPVAQQSAPVTLSDVITAGRNLGLWA